MQKQEISFKVFLLLLDLLAIFLLIDLGGIPDLTYASTSFKVSVILSIVAFCLIVLSQLTPIPLQNKEKTACLFFLGLWHICGRDVFQKYDLNAWQAKLAIVLGDLAITATALAFILGK